MECTMSFKDLEKPTKNASYDVKITDTNSETWEYTLTEIPAIKEGIVIIVTDDTTDIFNWHNIACMECTRGDE